MQYLCILKQVQHRFMKNKTNIWSEILGIILLVFLMLFIVINNGTMPKYQIISKPFFTTHCYSIDNSLLLHCFPVVILLIFSLLFWRVFVCKKQASETITHSLGEGRLVRIASFVERPPNSSSQPFSAQQGFRLYPIYVLNKFRLACLKC